jgi:hypothetical protein
MKTEKSKAAARENLRAGGEKILAAMNAYASPLTADGIADETGLPVHFVQIVLSGLLEQGKVKLGEEIEGTKTFALS